MYFCLPDQQKTGVLNGPVKPSQHKSATRCAIRGQHLRAHLGQGRLAEGQPSPLDELILSCLPESLAWRLDLYTLEDCDPIVAHYTPIVYPWYAQYRTADTWLKQLMNLAEQALLLCLRPPLNHMRDSERAALPEKYARRLERLSSALPH